MELEIGDWGSEERGIRGSDSEWINSLTFYPLEFRSFTDLLFVFGNLDREEVSKAVEAVVGLSDVAVRAREVKNG